MTGFQAYDTGGTKGPECLSPCPGDGFRNSEDGKCSEPLWKQILKVIGILTGVASFVAVAFKVHLFFKLRHHKRLAPGYTGLAGFFAVFAFGTKGDHTLERVHPKGKNQTPVGDVELSGEAKVDEVHDGATGRNQEDNESSVQLTVLNEGGRTASVDFDDVPRSTSNPFESRGRTDSVVMNPACSVDEARSAETDAAVSAAGRPQALLASMDVLQLCAWLRDTVGVNESVLEACAAEGVDGTTMDSIVRRQDTEALVEIGMSSRLKTNKLFGAWQTNTM